MLVCVFKLVCALVCNSKLVYVLLNICAFMCSQTCMCTCMYYNIYFNHPPIFNRPGADGAFLQTPLWFIESVGQPFVRARDHKFSLHIQALVCAIVCAPKLLCAVKLVCVLLCMLVCAPKLVCALVCTSKLVYMLQNFICACMISQAHICTRIWSKIYF